MSTETRMPRALIIALMFSTAIGAGSGAWLASGQVSAAANAAPLSVTPQNPQPGFASLVAKVKPAVVQIATLSVPGQASEEGQDGNAAPQMPNLPPQLGDMFRRYFGQPGNGGMGNAQRSQRAAGSGFIIDPAGYIVTNNHVVDGARDVSVTLTDGNKYSAKVVGRDAKTDLALLKISAEKPLPYVAFGNSDAAQEGDWVIAVGNPYGLGGTVTAGIISAHGRNINAGPYDDFMQIDASINPGNSGGPLFNQAGQVVAIDTAIYSPTGGSVGIGFAIPANVAKSVLTQLREHGTVARGWLGVQMQPLTPALAKAVGLPNTDGVVVDTVESGSPAARADLQQGDVITAFNGKPIKDARDLAMAVAGTPSGDKASMTVWRNQGTHSMTVTIGSEEKKVQTASAAGNGAAPPKAVGMSLQPLTPDTRAVLNLGPSTAGVLVAQVTPGSRAEESGVQVGDIIERVGANKVSSPAEVASAIRAAEQQKKQAISLLVHRNGVSSYLGLQLA